MKDKRLDMNSGSGYSFLEMINFLKKPKEEVILMKPIQIAILRNMDMKFGSLNTRETTGSD